MCPLFSGSECSVRTGQGFMCRAVTKLKYRRNDTSFKYYVLFHQSAHEEQIRIVEAILRPTQLRYWHNKGSVAMRKKVIIWLKSKLSSSRAILLMKSLRIKG